MGFGPTLSDQVRANAASDGDALALVCAEERLSYRALDTLADRIAAALQRDGADNGDGVAICAGASTTYIAAMIGAARAGARVALVAPNLTPETIRAMIADSGARRVFVDTAAPMAIEGATSLDPSGLERWLAGAPDTPRPVEIAADQAFSIIYSSGTTGVPKGIVHSHAMRARLIAAQAPLGFGRDTVTLASTPLYSNTTLTTLLPTLAFGGVAVLMPKFSPAEFLALAERWRVTHAMLVPNQYARILAEPDFDRRDLASFQMKFCTSAPFPAALKRETLARWPGGLVEFYGLTEGGGSCVLFAHLFPDKLDTVGQPAPGHDIRLVDEDGREVPIGEIGEIIGHSGGVMSGYHNRPEDTANSFWDAPDGRRFVRTGDLGRFDADGFLTLVGRKKDVIISGGFNIYPVDLEAALAQHDGVIDAAVVGVADPRWGETPVAFVVARAGAERQELLDFANQRLGRTQRLTDLVLVDALPRSAIGKVLKRELRAAYEAARA